MTGMPDLIAKTRVFNGIDNLLNGSTVTELLAYQTALKTTLLGDLVSDLYDAGKLKIKPEDVEHLLYDVFGREKEGTKKPWWNKDVESIATEGYAQLVQHMCYEDPYSIDDSGNLGRGKRPDANAKNVDTLWLCPATYYFRTIVSKNPGNADWVTFLVLTPPKKDHPDHYGKYKGRLPSKKKEKHDQTPVEYDYAENLWITGLEEDNVKKGKRKSDGSEIDLSVEIDPITEFAPPADTIQPLAEHYLDADPADERRQY